MGGVPVEVVYLMGIKAIFTLLDPMRNRIVFDGLPSEQHRKAKSRRDKKHETEG